MRTFADQPQLTRQSLQEARAEGYRAWCLQETGRDIRQIIPPTRYQAGA